MNHGNTRDNHQAQPKEGLGHKIAAAVKSKLPGHHDEADSHQKTGTVDDPFQVANTGTDRGLNHSSPYASANERGDHGPGVVDKVKSTLPGQNERLDSHHQHKPNSDLRDNDPMSANYTGSTHDKEHGLKQTDHYAVPPATGGYHQHDDTSVVDKLKNKLPDSMTSHLDKSDTHLTTDNGGHNARSHTGVSIGGYPATSAGHTQDQQPAGLNKSVDREGLFGDSTSSRLQQPRGNTSTTY